METIIVKYGVEILFGLVSAGALGFCKYLHSQLKQYKKLLEIKEKNEFEDVIEQHLDPIVKDIEDLRKYVMSVDTKEKEKMALIISSYRFRLIELCKLYIRQEYMTQEQYDQLIEFYKVYSGLGGNGPAKEYYEKAIALPIINL